MVKNGLEVILGGHNVAIEFVKGETDVSTPEVLSASGARLSRDPRTVDQLREVALNHVKNAKKSNNAIIYGIGHASVAEHAYFNFSISGMSRYAVETLQKFRLASFTEKSQRYQEMTEKDFMIPKEIESIPEAKKIFENVLKIQVGAYKKLYASLRKNILDDSKADIQKLKDSGAKDADIKKLITTREGWAKEDARYTLPLATTANVILSANGRVIENMIPWFRTFGLDEHSDFAEKLYDSAKEYDSIIKYHEPTEHMLNRNNVAEMLSKYTTGLKGDQPMKVRVDLNSDNVILKKLFLDLAGKKISYSEILNMPFGTKEKIYKSVFEKMNMHDVVPRAFEFADVEVSYDVSASHFAQLKRHRMMTLEEGNYDITKTKEIPPRVTQYGYEDILKEVYTKTDEAYKKLVPLVGEKVATYALTNGHKRHVSYKANMKQMYAMSRLREDAHAQWSIRRDTNTIMYKVREFAPLSGMMLCGKSEFEDKYKSMFDC